jgi:BirA family transcriptional regulator, biotin operon repressor / biotin---[acetyl-CoA-carboxylase] ligase
MSFASELKPLLTTKRFGRKLFAFETIDSTNICAKTLAGVGSETGTVVFSEEQTSGRGRLGRSWQADPFKNLTFSVILRPKVSPEDLNLLPLYVAVATAQAVEQTCGVRVECKWPNDLLTDGRKFAGILLEGSVVNGNVDFLVAGIGINVNQVAFPGELQHRATSLAVALGHEVERAALLAAILSSLELLDERLSVAGFTSVVSMWLPYTTMVDKRIVVSQAGVLTEGVVRGLSRDGGLILVTEGQERTYYAGDITIVEM